MIPNLSIIKILPKQVTDIYIKFKSITSKLPNTSASIAFIKKSLFIDVIPGNISDRHIILLPCVVTIAYSKVAALKISHGKRQLLQQNSIAAEPI